MDYKILNEEYRIAAAKIPRKTPGISICYSRADVILINDDAAGLDGIVDLFATYLSLDDLGAWKYGIIRRMRRLRACFARWIVLTVSASTCVSWGGRNPAMDQGKVFARLVKVAGAEDLNVAFVPLQASYGRLKGDRLALCFGMDIDKMTYTLAHELAHHFLHYDKGNTIDSEKHDEYEEQADRAAKMLLQALSVT